MHPLPRNQAPSGRLSATVDLASELGKQGGDPASKRLEKNLQTLVLVDSLYDSMASGDARDPFAR